MRSVAKVPRAENAPRRSRVRRSMGFSSIWLLRCRCAVRTAHCATRVDQAVCPCYGLSYHMMTDASGSQVRTGRPSPSLSMIRPLPPPRSLTGELVARLTDDIISGKIAPGSQLPTEQELIAATGVSRTVVREAVAPLPAQALVVTPHRPAPF